MIRYAYIALGLLCVGLAAVGVVVPGLPTTPFLLVASWAFYRSSPRLQAWLLASRLGGRIRNFERDKGMSRKAKASAIGCMAVMCSISIIFFIPSTLIKVVVGMAGMVGCLTVAFVVRTVEHKAEPADE
ncbi:MAG: YbaN family protein [Paludibacteraceae bacterium]|nr:YbaN family protein [Paludibacteraceae bacterium]